MSANQRILKVLYCLVVYGPLTVVDQSAAQKNGQCEDPGVILLITLKKQMEQKKRMEYRNSLTVSGTN